MELVDKNKTKVKCNWRKSRIIFPRENELLVLLKFEMPSRENSYALYPRWQLRD